MIEITEAAAAVLEKAGKAAARLNPDAAIRVFRVEDEIEIGLTDEPGPGYEVVERGGAKIYIQNGITGTLDVSEEHERLYVR